MRGAPTTFWGKLELADDETVGAWHPLIDHCADVAAVTSTLLDQATIRQRLARLGGRDDLEPVQCARLVALAALHDIGKHNIGFQNKALRDGSSRAGHVREVLDIFGSATGVEDQLMDAIDWSSIRRWSTGDEASGHLLIASIAHHGRPLAPGGTGPSIRLWTPDRGLDPFAGMRELRDNVRRWVPSAFDSQDASPIPDAAEFQHAFSGLVTLADWLGSDTRFFPYSAEHETDRFARSLIAADAAALAVGLRADASRRALGLSPPAFSTISERPARPMQRHLAEQDVRANGSVTVLEAETGSGKTEAALAFFIRAFHAGHVDGMYFALPTRTAATQIQARIVRAIKRAFPDEDSRPAVVLAVPGYVRVDDVCGQRLPGFEVLWNDRDHERFRFRGWAAENPKRYLAGQIVVGTVDQVLLSALAVSHSHLRATSLLRSLLVVDEVHASDAYMIRLLEEVIGRMTRAGGHTLLMSATLASSARERLLTAVPRRLREKSSPLQGYPSVVAAAPGSADQVAYPAAVPYVRTIRVRKFLDLLDGAAVAREALQLADMGLRVLVIRNTVSACCDTQLSLEKEAAENRRHLLFSCRGACAPHHSRFARSDREALDHALETALGQGAAVGGLVLVATQTVQQSLDIDADVLITDLCPMDVLLQRLGRIRRHPDRIGHLPAGQGDLMALVPADRDLARYLHRDGGARGPCGIGTVYDDLRILEATWRELERRTRLVLPRDCRELVESCVNASAMEELVNGLEGLWRRHHEAVAGKGFAQRRQAQLNVANWSAPFGTTEAEFPDKELSGVIRTRLGESDRLVAFADSPRGPFGLPVTSLTIPGHLAPHGEAELIPVDIDPVEIGGMTFGLSGSRYVYDRLGLRLASREPAADGGPRVDS